MKDKLSAQDIAKIFKTALSANNVLDKNDTAVIFYDLDYLEERIENLIELFPKTALHTLAVKANPLVKILKRIKKLGAGLEAASMPELCIALKSGYEPQKIVFDSPVKTTQELEFALENGVHINADSFAEMERIDNIIEKTGFKSTIGVRINPQTGSGKILATSVAGEYSKFGIPIKEYRTEIIDSFHKYSWLTGIHLHVGSQGCEMTMLLDGISSILELVEEINVSLKRANIKKRIRIFDMGGGLPVSYHYGEIPVSMEEYKNALYARFERLFSDEFRLITEFGRYVHANTGFTASRVEYVKMDRTINTAMIHVGADMFLRKCYRPDEWHHDITIVDKYGNIKTSGNARYNIAGPLCFAGDIIASGISLPTIAEGDYVLIHDTGAYTLSMWSRYNSRQIPKVIGFDKSTNNFETLKDRETPEQLYDFWN